MIRNNKRSTFDPTAMDEAADAAHEELQDIRNKMSAEELGGVEQLIDWLARHYLKAGYKRLCRPLVRPQ